MGKYGQLIEQARAESGELESQQTRKPERVKTRKPDGQKTRRMENQKTRNDELSDFGQLVNLGVKVPLAWRRHWAAESKRTGVSMTEVIIRALTNEFGEPEAK